MMVGINMYRIMFIMGFLLGTSITLLVIELISLFRKGKNE